ncbi:UNVERIFIED_CONTAM: hypothetical protein BEN50_10830 [Euhalothece sp. KZN 001]
MNYKTQALDTTIEAEKIQFQIWRRLSLEQKTQQVRSLQQRLRTILWQNITQKLPQGDDRRRKQKLIELEQGENFSQIDQVLESNFMLQDPIELAALVGQIFDRLEIPYFVSGGLASSILGETRTTIDADIAILMSDKRLIPQLIEIMQTDFYISEIAVEDALNNRASSFNIIHLQSALKADIYPIRDNDLFRQSAIARRQKINLVDSPELSFNICTAEDIVLQKLIWYQTTGQISQKQWRDILGVLKLQGERLDFQYMRYWSEALRIVQLLENACDESGLNP